MAEITPKSGVLIMANGDTFTPNGKKIKIKAVRLIAGSANATATITSNSDSKVIYSMAAVIGTADESVVETNIDSTQITAALAGTGASLYVYLG